MSVNNQNSGLWYRSRVVTDASLPKLLKYKHDFRPTKSWKTHLKLWFEVGQTILSILYSIMFIVENYVSLSGTPSKVYDIIDLVLCALFIFIFFTEFLIEWKLGYLVTWHAVLDYLSIVPIFILTISSLAGAKWNAQFFQFIRIMRLFRLFVLFFDINRISVFSSVKSTVKKALTLVFTIITLILFYAAVFQAFENNFSDGPVLYYHDAVYLITVTLLTIGYGDVVPRTIIGKFLIILFVVSGLIIIPYQFGKLLQLIISGRKFYHELFDLNIVGHIVVAGCSTPEEVIEFTEELYLHLHKRDMETKIVLAFQEKEMEDPLLRQFSSSNYNGRIIVHICDCTSMHELAVMKLVSTQCIYLLNTRNRKESLKRDARILLQAKAIKAYHQKAVILVQVTNMRYKEKLLQVPVDDCFSLDESRLQLLNTSILVPGLPIILNNLMTTYSQSAKRLDSAGFMRDYAGGLGSGLYIVPISITFIGVGIQEFFALCYSKMELFCLGIERKGVYLMNPTDIFLESTDQVILLAQSTFHADFISHYVEDSHSLLSLRGSGFGYDTFGQEGSIEVLEKGQILLLGDFKLVEHFIKDMSQEFVLLTHLHQKSADYIELKERIREYTNTIIVHGDSTNYGDLQRIEIEKFHTILFMSEEGNEGDETAVETFMAIEKCNLPSSNKVICEFLHHNSLRYFTPLVNQISSRLNLLMKHSNEYLVFCPNYASGTMFSCSNLINKVMCETFFNKSLPKILGNLINGSVKYTTHQTDDISFERLFQRSMGKGNGMIIFAIYSQARNSNETGLVVTCPPSNMMVYKGDGIYYV